MLGFANKKEPNHTPISGAVSPLPAVWQGHGGLLSSVKGGNVGHKTG